MVPAALRSTVSVLVVLAAGAALTSLASADAPSPASATIRRGLPATHGEVRVWRIFYRAHTGARRRAFVVLPARYGPRRRTPAMPLVISPHGRGQTGRLNTRIWGALPARGSFALVSPDGQGRRLSRYSWGFAGQIDDLARMPDIVARALPWLRVDRRRIYAFGGSMGGQETLLLVARHPGLLAGAAAFDAVADLGRQYRALPRLACNLRCREAWDEPIGKGLQQLVREEVGGSPGDVPAAFARRSPLTYAREIANSCVGLQLWWSMSDLVVLDQGRQSGRLFRTIRRLNPDAPVTAFVGSWIHTAEMQAESRLPLALAEFGLLPATVEPPVGLRIVPPPAAGGPCAWTDDSSGASGARG